MYAEVQLIARSTYFYLHLAERLYLFLSKMELVTISACFFHLEIRRLKCLAIVHRPERRVIFDGIQHIPSVHSSALEGT